MTAPPTVEEIRGAAFEQARASVMTEATQHIKEIEEAAKQQVAQANQRANELTTELEKLRARVDALLLNQNSASPDPTPTSAPAPGKPLLPKPSIFSGNKAEFPGWKRFMMIKIPTDVVDNAYIRANYLSAFVSGDAQTYVNSFLARHSTCSYLEVLEHLTHRFDDPHRQENALRKLNQLEMKSCMTFDEFVDKYETYENEAGADTWDDRARVNAMKGKLPTWLRAIIVGSVTPEQENDFSTFVMRVRTLVNRHNEARSYEKSSNNGGGTGKKRMSEAVPTPALPVVTLANDAMDWTRTAATTTDAARPYAPKYSRKEYVARLKAKVCTTCGNPGHFSRKCGYQRARDQEQFKTESTRAAVAGIRQLADAYQVSGDESEKE